MSDELKPAIGHLTLRVPWHDRKWSGHVCDQPAANSFCVMLDRIREKRIDELEARVAGQGWAQLRPEELPPCIAENGGCMNASRWRRRVEHPYVNIASVRDSHGVLERTWVEVPEYATFAVPFWWMLRKNQRSIDDGIPIPLPPDSDPPFESPWVFDAERQRALLKRVFGRVTEASSLAIFYTKDGHPFGEGINRLIIGIGTVTRVSRILEYRSHAPHTYPLWDTLISHSIRPDGAAGFLLPYHEYLQAGHDGANPRDPLNEILVVPDSGHTREFSYGAEIAGPDVALATLVRCLEAVRQVRQHGIAHGPWERREEWLNKQIAAVWKARGAYPGLGSALEAFGLRLGTSLYRQLVMGGTIGADDAWAVMDRLFRGKVKFPEPDYSADLESLQEMWIELPDERRALLKLLSRFDLSPQQAKRWYDEKRRAQATLSTVTDSDIIANPSVIAENDLGDGDEPGVSFGTLDRGLLPEPAIRVRHPIPEPSAVAAPTDDRRLRAALVVVLRQMETEGDTLLSVGEASERSTRLDASTPVELPPDWLTPERQTLKGHVELVQATLGHQGKTVLGVQLARTRRFEAQLRKVLLARSARIEQAVVADWPVLLKEAITAAGGEFDADNPRHVQALSEQAAVVETVVSRRATTLVGRAGTGKTSVLGALLLCPQISAGGVLLLAPTGKATVRLAGAARAEARTIASFLHSLGRYDVRRNRVLVQETKRYAGASTVIVDECSMLTLEMLVALLDALDLQRVKRLILVGDPNQLPPIGAGRPFADFVAFLDQAGRSDDEQVRRVGSAQARLTVEVRSTAGEPSDTLRLASWFTREPQPVDADRVLSDLDLGHSFNDLEVCYWRTAAELRGRLIEQFQQHLGLNSENDVNAFNRALGLEMTATPTLAT